MVSSGDQRIQTNLNSQQNSSIQQLAASIAADVQVIPLNSIIIRIQYKSPEFPGALWATHWKELCLAAQSAGYRTVQICSSNELHLPGYYFNVQSVLDYVASLETVAEESIDSPEIFEVNLV